MAILLRADGTCEVVEPKDGAYWTLEELQGFVGGYIEMARTEDGRWLVVNEEGRRMELRHNVEASRLYARRIPIVGDVLLTDDLKQFNRPEEDDDEGTN